MPIGDNAVFTNPIIIEEQFQMTGLDIQNPFREKAYQIAQLPLQTGILPHAEKIGIRFQNMQMGIHRLALVLILGAEAHVGYLSPFAVKASQ